MARRTARPRAALAVLAVAALTACGARSGLLAPDIDVRPNTPADASTALDALDARVVPPVDAAPPCTRHAECADAIDCTEDRCDATSHRCVHTPRDATCNDGLVCNGAERCVVDVGCVRDPFRCDDGVACTRDRCDERAARCVADADDTLCPLSHGCDVRAGCVARALAHGPTGLYAIRLPTGEVSRLAPLPAGLTDIALRPDGALYAVGRGVLHQLNMVTGAAIASVRIDADFTALDAAPDGTLYAGAGGSVYRIDPATGVSTEAGQFPPGLEASGDLAFFEGRLLATARTDPTSLDTLVEFDLASGAVRTIGPVGISCVWGLAAFGDTLYGLTCRGQVLRIDPASGRGTVLTTGTWNFYGATAR